MEVPGEVQVDLVPGLHPGPAASRGPALHPENRAQGGLPEGQGRPFPKPP